MSGAEARKKLVKALTDGLKEGQEHADEIEAERFARSLGAQGSKFIEGDPVPLPELEPDGSVKQK